MEQKAKGKVQTNRVARQRAALGHIAIIGSKEKRSTKPEESDSRTNRNALDTLMKSQEAKAKGRPFGVGTGKDKVRLEDGQKNVVKVEEE